MKSYWILVFMFCLVFSAMGPANFASASAAPTNATAKNILTNGGFEEPVVDGKIPGWTVSSGGELVSVSNTRAQEGSSSLRVAKASQNVGVRMDSVKANVYGGEEYILSTQLYLDSGQMSGMYVYSFDEQGNPVKGVDGKDFTTYIINATTLAKGQWHYLEQKFTVPAGTKQVMVSLITSNRTDRSYQYNLDEISIVRLADLAAPQTPIPAAATKVDSTDPALIGAPVSVEPFDNVYWTAKTLTQAGSGGKVDLRFYDENDKIVSTVSANVYAGLGEWADARIAASAARNAKYLRTAMYFPEGKSGVYFADEINLQVQPTPDNITNLGPQSKTTTAMMGAYGKDKNGRDVLYTVIQGDPGQLAIVHVNTGQVTGVHSLVALDGSPVTAAWGVTVATDGKAYMGSTPNGTLFQYDPMTDQVRALGKPVAGDTVIWVLEPGANGKVYGGTGYSQSIFEYDPATDKMRTLAAFKYGSKQDHIRSLAYDPVGDVLYAGGADVAKLFRYDVKTGTTKEIPIPETSGKTSVYDLQYAGGLLFVRVDSGPQMFVYDPANDHWVVKANKQYNARGFSPLSPDNRIFYTYPTPNGSGGTKYTLYEYNVTTNVYGPIDVDLKGVAVSYGYVKLEDPEFPGTTLVGLAGNNGMSFYYNLETGKVKTYEIPLPPQFAEIHNIGKGLDGKILTAGFISGGGLGIYSPSKDETKLELLIGQIEGYASLNGKMYFGVYPGATLFEYDPKQPWNRTDPSKPTNPLRLLQVETTQDRPIAMVGVEEINKVYIGTFPKAGNIGGALSIYDPVTRKIEVKKNIIPNHSINTILHKDGKLYIGTGDMVGKSGQLFIYDIATNTIEFQTVPVANKKALSAFTWGPDGNLWGMAQGTLFIFDPVIETVIYQDDKFPAADYTQNNARLHVGTDNNLYGSIYTGYVADNTYTSKLFRIDSATKEMSILLESHVDKLAQDDFGNFYFKYGSLLMKYSDPALVVKMIGAALELPAQSIQVGASMQAQVKAQLEKGRRTMELTGAQISYRSSMPTAAKIGHNGVITAINAGATELVATVTLNGVTVETGKVLLIVTNPYSDPSAETEDSQKKNMTIHVGPKSPADGSIGIPLEIKRSMEQDGTIKDEIKLVVDKIKEIAKQMGEAKSRTASIVMPDDQDEVSEWAIHIDADSTAALSKDGMDLALVNNHVKITVPSASLNDRKEEVYFRIEPLRKQEQQSDTERRANSDSTIANLAGHAPVEVVGRPMKIETNLQNKSVDLVLPIDTTRISAAELAQLGVYIEHSDGTKELVRGEIVNFGDHGKGLQITVHKFSLFTVVKVNGWTADSSAVVTTYMNGYSDGSFRPENSVTRAEVAAMMARISNAEQGTASATFEDVSAGHWAHSYVSSAAQLGIMKGYEDGSFKPDQEITRAEMASVLLPLLKENKGQAASSAYADLSGHWANETVAKLHASGIVSGYEDGTFRPDTALTRAEAVTMINRLLGISPAAGTEAIWNDVPASHWAYAAIQAVSGWLAD